MEVCMVGINLEKIAERQNSEWKRRMIMGGKFSNLSNWKEEAWKKKYQGFNGIRTRDLCVAGALLYQPSYEATHWEQD